mgnify:FL=1
MSMFDQLAGNLIHSALGQQGQDHPLLGAIVGLIQNHQGGLAGLIEQFKASGLAEQAASWVGTGSNLPISAEQLQQVLGSGTLAQLAGQLGISPGAASQSLADLLPGVIDKLTPNGQIEGGDVLQQGLSLLGGLFANKG